MSNPDTRLGQRSKEKNELIIGYLTLRQLIGWMGVLLPPVIYFGNWLIFTHAYASCLVPSSHVPYSLSGYYYTHMRGLFTGTFWAFGVFLVAYNGYDFWDQAITTVAGLAAIGIAVFPTNPPASFLAAQRGNCGPLVPIMYQSSPHQTIISVGHGVSLILLITTLVLMAWRFRYTGTEAEQAGKTAKEKALKSRKNKVYLVSAVFIALGGAGAFVQNFLPKSVQAEAPLLFICEMVAVLAFGVAWFAKGAAIGAVIKFAKDPHHRQGGQTGHGSA